MWALLKVKPGVGSVKGEVRNGALLMVGEKLHPWESK